jgi:hypothetical protein
MNDFVHAHGGGAISHRDGINGRSHKVNAEILVLIAGRNQSISPLLIN